MATHDDVVQGLELCASNWQIYNAAQWASDLSTLLLTFTEVRDATPEEWASVIRSHIAEADNRPKVKDLLDRLKALREAQRAATRGPVRALGCQYCASGFIEAAVWRGQWRNPEIGVVAVRCWWCGNGASRQELEAGWRKQLGDRLLQVLWGQPMVTREQRGQAEQAPAPARSGGQQVLSFTPNPEAHDPYRWERKAARDRALAEANQ